MKKFSFSLITFYCCIYLSDPYTYALKIEITQGQVRPDPIAITNFYSTDSTLQDLGENISKVVSDDLQRSGLFEPITRDAFIQTEASLIKAVPRYADWRLIKARFLVCGTIRYEGITNVTISFRLYDVITGQQMLGLSLSAERLKWRKLSHIIADTIYSRITNEKGLFNTHIVYSEVVGGRGKTQKRLMRADQDGENRQALTDGKSLVLMPRFSPDGKKIAYLKYSKNAAFVHVMDLSDGKEKTLGGLDKHLRNFGEMTFAPRFLPDSKSLIMSLVKDGKSAIYHYNLITGTLEPLTAHRSIDTSPCASPDGKQIVFTSDRDREGGEQMFIMDIKGGNVRRISWGEGKYSQPVWSPRGDYIAFTKQHKGRFYIGLMSPEGTSERLIAQGYLVEAPSWSPNGRYLVFTKEDKSSGPGRIVMMDLTGTHQILIKTTGDVSDCTWSPLLD